jgi:hypothetical protein
MPSERGNDQRVALSRGGRNEAVSVWIYIGAAGVMLAALLIMALEGHEDPKPPPLWIPPPD